MGGLKREWDSYTPSNSGSEGPSQSSSKTWEGKTQLSGTARVTGDVASIALDRGILLGSAAADTAVAPEQAQASMTETPVPEMLSDAEVMLRVAAGDSEVEGVCLSHSRFWPPIRIVANCCATAV